MATKQELQTTMKSFGYDLNPFTSKETLLNLMRLHSKVRHLKKDCADEEKLVSSGFGKRYRCTENE